MNPLFTRCCSLAPHLSVFFLGAQEVIPHLCMENTTPLIKGMKEWRTAFDSTGIVKGCNELAHEQHSGLVALM